MGVNGLTGFLRKKAPQVLRELPNRLQGLNGKTIVMCEYLISCDLDYLTVILTAMVHSSRSVCTSHSCLTNTDTFSDGIASCRSYKRMESAPYACLMGLRALPRRRRNKPREKQRRLSLLLEAHWRMSVLFGWTNSARCCIKPRHSSLRSLSINTSCVLAVKIVQSVHSISTTQANLSPRSL
ncbi:hypothetical protein BKA62DRAFT_373976 [Auriculariales sp. MPI-PUGE-AT-0066]|nr:hypothetical protein BKA62DRAFT_373976 [Auriculariales sp. MPI-PUGE-AT-0066]